ncbi:RNA polymerase sigma factor [Streptomyces sp. 11x1]|uniref:RNA polymerase sigma factor n=1 Tax=Streptomyces sp. 11x1 TaxID=3038642 RepID=UPI0029312A57|nr:RNA polymerase sigma factor [Streptomyces sp. 11x1]WNZ14872.1 RNA polymerase sigma factor [Streptomyces sp. 11x1]
MNTGTPGTRTAEDIAGEVERLVSVMLESDDDHAVDGAYRHLYRLTLPRLTAWLARRESNEHIREELLQEIWFKALRHLYADRYTPRENGSFLAWLFSIAGSVHTDYLRRCKVRANDHLTADMLMLDRASEQMGPEDAAETRQVAEAVAQLLATLPQGQQDVLKLRFFEGLSTGEVAVKLGKREGNIRTLQHRGLSKLAAVIPSPSSGKPVVEYLLTVAAGAHRVISGPGETNTLREKVEHARTR